MIKDKTQFNSDEINILYKSLYDIINAIDKGLIIIYSHAEYFEPDLNYINAAREALANTKFTDKELVIKESDTFLTRKEAMDLLRISPVTLWRWERHGSIPKGIRIGGKVYFRKKDLDQFIVDQNFS